MMAEPAAQIVDWAMHYAGLGWHLFPVHALGASGCSCGRRDCSSPGKHPMTPNGLHDSSNDPARIVAWWTANPAANIGLDCGKSGVTVIDEDVKNGALGKVSIALYLKRHPEFSTTLIAGTPSGGLHYFFSGRSKTSHGRLGKGLDVQGDGAYVILPPSWGGHYRWLNNNAVQRLPQLQEPEGIDFNAPPSNYEGEARSKIPYGEHRDALIRLAYTARRVLGLDVNATANMLQGYIASGALEGYDSKRPFTRNDLEGMAKRLEPNVAPPPQQPLDILAPIRNADQVESNPLPERQIIIPQFMLRGELHVIYGTDGSKKTTLVAYLLALVSRLGLDVLIFISEDQPNDFLQKYLLAGGVRERFNFYDVSLLRGDFLLPKHKADLEKIIQSRAWGCVYFDSINDFKAMDGRLNAADEARQMFGPLQMLAQRYDVAIVCTLHTNARDVLEGARQIRAKARVIAHVTPPKVEEDDEGIDFSRIAYDPETTALVTTEKFSRGRPNAKFVFYFRAFLSNEFDIQPDGRRTPKEHFVCTGHEQIASLPSRPELGRPKNMIVSQERREEVERILLDRPGISANEVYKLVGGNRSEVQALVRETKERHRG